MANAVAAVIGWPVEHSLSPRLHNYWLKQYNLPGEYIAIPVAPEKLQEMLETLPKSGMRGVNVTIPHKKSVMPLIKDLRGGFDRLARDIDAVNTIIVRDEKLYGINTDVYGFSENIRPHLTGEKSKAVLLGAGGAAKSVAKSLIDLGFDEIIILNRTMDKAVAIAHQFRTQKLIKTALWDERSAVLGGTDLLVNTTSLGLAGKEPLDIDLSSLPRRAIVTDVVYKPLITPFLEAARARGNTVVDGLGMLIHQAVPAFEAWFSIRPEVTDDLRRHLLET